MNERIKRVRKYYKLSQEKFGEQLGVTKTAVSKMELGTYKVTDTMAKLICSEYNVSLDWLRYGKGNMFVETNAISLDEYAKAKGATELEIDIIKGYLELDSSTRKMLITHFKSIIQRHDHKESDHLSIVKDESTTVAAHNDAELDDEELKRMREDLEEL
ncbi:helix-turn-helix transcriptional regulator [Fusibacter sp. JL298sf-3]